MITMYSKSHCPHCDGAEAWLTRHAMPFTKIDVSADPTALAFLHEGGHRTVPQFYVGKTLIVSGGFSGLRAMGAERLMENVRRMPSESL